MSLCTALAQPWLWRCLCVLSFIHLKLRIRNPFKWFSNLAIISFINKIVCFSLNIHNCFFFFYYKYIVHYSLLLYFVKFFEEGAICANWFKRNVVVFSYFSATNPTQNVEKIILKLLMTNKLARKVIEKDLSK